MQGKSITAYTPLQVCCHIENAAHNVLATQRLREIPQESVGHPALDEYFTKMAAFEETLAGYYTFVKQGGMETGTLEQLRDWNHKLYSDILPENYGQSWGNPAYAVAKMDEQWGRLLTYVYISISFSVTYRP